MAMSVESLCEICLTESVEHTCNRCGNLVCDRHFDESVGFCTECSADLGIDRSDQTDDSTDSPDGVDTYRS